MRLIDADKLEYQMLYKENFLKGSGHEAQAIWKEDIDSQPTIDAVPVVRCRDCKHKPSGSGVNHDISFPDEVCPCQCEDYWYSWMPKDNWFCGSWERRIDE